MVGPRPLPIREVSRFDNAALMRRFSVKPGLTCLWQISGRSNTDFERWITLDLKYIDEWSLGLDFKILIWTFPAVLGGVARSNNIAEVMSIARGEKFGFFVWSPYA